MILFRRHITLGHSGASVAECVGAYRAVLHGALRSRRVPCAASCTVEYAAYRTVPFLQGLGTLRSHSGLVDHFWGIEINARFYSLPPVLNTLEIFGRFHSLPPVLNSLEIFGRFHSLPPMLNSLEIFGRCVNTPPVILVTGPGSCAGIFAHLLRRGRSSGNPCWNCPGEDRRGYLCKIP